jgi:hypothetical protein
MNSNPAWFIIGFYLVWMVGVAWFFIEATGGL